MQSLVLIYVRWKTDWDNQVDKIGKTKLYGKDCNYRISGSMFSFASMASIKNLDLLNN